MTTKISWKKDKRLQRILKENAERRAEERYGQNKGLELAVTIVAGIAFLVGGVAAIVLGIAWLLLMFVGIIIAAFAIPSMFKG